MATLEQIEAAKYKLPADAEEYGWDDGRIAALIDAQVTGNAFLLAYWEKVASDTAGYVDMSESGSSRSLSQIHKNAVSMAKIYRDLVAKEANPDPINKIGIRSKAIRRV